VTLKWILMVIRLLLGALLIRQGVIGLSDLAHLAQSMQAHDAWQRWPLLGSLRPIEMALWIAASQLTVGIFLAAGLLTRLMALGAALLAAFAVLALADLGLVPNLAHAGLLILSLAVLIKGGGAGTLDAELGRMQRRALEREAQRDAARWSRRPS
jgi:uncharacterized membrane protein YphA (DoxX/SURF4 family)